MPDASFPPQSSGTQSRVGVRGDTPGSVRGPVTPWVGPARQEEAAGGGLRKGQGKRNLGPARSACLFLHPISKGARTAGPWLSLSVNVIPRESGVFGKLDPGRGCSEALSPPGEPETRELLASGI